MDHAEIAADCTVTCSHTTMTNCCGNGVVEAGEICDDGNQAPFDGCSPQCKFERALVLNQIGYLPPGSGCDLSDPPDGTVDEAVNNAINDAARMWINNWLANDLQMEPAVVLLAMTGLDDQTAQSGSFTFSTLEGVEVNGGRTDYFSGNQAFNVTPMYLDMRGTPISPLSVSVTSGQITTTAPGTMLMPYPLTTIYPFRVHRVHLEGTIVSDATRPTEITITKLCGGFAAWSMSQVKSPDTSTGSSLLDAMALGDMFFSYRVTPTQPDLDIDGDGLETFFDDDGNRKIDRCVDGNGTQILGETCPMDPRIADAYSMTMYMHGVGTMLKGMAP